MNRTQKNPEQQPKTMDVSDRLRKFSADCGELADSLPETRTGKRLADCILTHAFSAYLFHGKAEGSLSAKEFADRFRDVLEELRQLRRALYFLLVSPMPKDRERVDKLVEDCDILVRIFFSSIRTLEGRASK